MEDALFTQPHPQQNGQIHLSMFLLTKLPIDLPTKNQQYDTFSTYPTKPTFHVFSSSLFWGHIEWSQKSQRRAQNLLKRKKDDITV